MALPLNRNEHRLEMKRRFQLDKSLNEGNKVINFPQKKIVSKHNDCVSKKQLPTSWNAQKVSQFTPSPNHLSTRLAQQKRKKFPKNSCDDKNNTNNNLLVQLFDDESICLPLLTNVVRWFFAVINAAYTVRCVKKLCFTVRMAHAKLFFEFKFTNFRTRNFDKVHLDSSLFYYCYFIHFFHLTRTNGNSQAKKFFLRSLFRREKLFYPMKMHVVC